MASAVPIVVGVQGWAAGGGLSLALLGDVLILDDQLGCGPHTRRSA
jgi:enoyl-CoA hydratase/carnithine racemase